MSPTDCLEACPIHCHGFVVATEDAALVASEVMWREAYKAALEAAAKACEVFERGYEHGANANKEGSSARKLMVERADVAKACARRIRMIPAPTMPGKDGGS